MHIQINPRSFLNLEHICEVLYKHSNEDKKANIYLSYHRTQNGHGGLLFSI